VSEICVALTLATVPTKTGDAGVTAGGWVSVGVAGLADGVVETGSVGEGSVGEELGTTVEARV
jgi:hypothetical protein